MHFTTRQFWQCYDSLADPIKQVADENYELLKTNPSHPSLGQTGNCFGFHQYPAEQAVPSIPNFPLNLRLGVYQVPLTELMSQIQELPKIEKLLLMQFLAIEMIEEENANFFVENQEYPVWSPYNCSGAANVLMNLLETKKQEQNG